MVIRKGIAVVAVLVAVVGISASAMAATVVDSNQDNDEGMKVTTTLLRDNKEFTCRGRNDRLNGGTANYMWVKTICQYKNGSNWVDFDTPSKLSAYYTDTTGNLAYVDNPCSGSDGGLNLPSGQWEVRAQADGFWSTGPETHVFHGGAAIHTEPDTVNCG